MSSAEDAGETAKPTPEAPAVGAATAALPRGLSSWARPTPRSNGTRSRPSRADPEARAAGVPRPPPGAEAATPGRPAPSKGGGGRGAIGLSSVQAEDAVG